MVTRFNEPWTEPAAMDEAPLPGDVQHEATSRFQKELFGQGAAAVMHGWETALQGAQRSTLLESNRQLPATAEAQAQRPDRLLINAQRSFQENGLTDATKKLFEDAIRVADGMFDQNDRQKTDQLIHILQTGVKVDGSTLSPQERLQAHQLVSQEFAGATLGMQYRMIYGHLLNQNKQYASAERVFKECIDCADKLPLASFQSELAQLGQDVKDTSLSRTAQAELVTAMQSIRGSGTSKDDGLMYMPITARKQAALFYVSGAEGAGSGLVKPEQAAAMVDEARAKEQELYGVDPDKNKGADQTLANIAQNIVPLLPENHKQRLDGFWRNALLDGGIAAVVLTGVGFAASILTKNPTFAQMGLATGEGALTLGGKVFFGAVAVADAALSRNLAHLAITGESESWSASAMHGTAGLAGVGAIIAARGQVNKFLMSHRLEKALSEVPITPAYPPVPRIVPIPTTPAPVIPIEEAGRNTAADVAKRMSESGAPVSLDTLGFLLARKRAGL